MKHPRNTRVPSGKFGTEPRLSRIIIVSAVLHLLFISLVAVPLKTKVRVFRSYSVRLVGPVEPLDAKRPLEKKIESDAISKITTAPQKTAEPAEKTTKEIISKPAPKADISLEDVASVEKEIERLRAISALTKKLEQEKQEEKKQKLREIKIVAKAALERPVDVRGIRTEVPGENTGNEEDSYGNIIQQAIQQHWAYSNFKTSGLLTIVSIKIKADGKIIVQEIEKSSGDVLFDRSVIKALLDASPIPPPPAGEIEIGLVFTP